MTSVRPGALGEPVVEAVSETRTTRPTAHEPQQEDPHHNLAALSRPGVQHEKRDDCRWEAHSTGHEERREPWPPNVERGWRVAHLPSLARGGQRAQDNADGPRNVWLMATVIGSRRRGQAPPPHVVFEALTQPHRQRPRPWLFLLDDEVEPEIIEALAPERVVWSSQWPEHPSARVTIDLESEGPGLGTDLRWTLEVDEPIPSGAAIGHLRRRLNELLNRDLRDHSDC